MRNVQGETVLITGGGAGMGLLWAKKFAADGARLVLWDLNEQALATAAAELRAQGAEVLTDVVNVVDRERIYAAAADVQSKTGGVSVLVNNAGVVFAGPLLDTPDDKLALTLDVDLKALFWTTKAFLPRMLERDHGHIINVASAAGFIGVPLMPAYCAAKWGVIGMTESVRLEVARLGKKGVRFTLFCPSFVNTGMFAGAKPPMLTKLLEPQAVIDIAYRAFKRDQYMVREPFMVKITPALKALLPVKLFDTVSDMLGASQSMAGWKGH